MYGYILCRYFCKSCPNRNKYRILGRHLFWSLLPKRFAENSIVPNARVSHRSRCSAPRRRRQKRTNHRRERAGSTPFEADLRWTRPLPNVSPAMSVPSECSKFILKRVLRVLNAHRANSAHASRLVQVDSSRQTSRAHQYQNECLGFSLPGVRIGIRAGGPKGPGGGRARHGLDSPVVLNRNWMAPCNSSSQLQYSYDVSLQMLASALSAC